MMYDKRPIRSVARSVAALAAATAVPAVAWGNPPSTESAVTSTLLSDDFSGGYGSWTIDSNTVGRTQFGQTPTLVTGAAGTVPTYARLELDTYNSTAGQAGKTLLGTQLHTDQAFSLPTSGGVDTGQGIRFQITARIEPTGISGTAAATIPTAAGLNAASFSYGYAAGTPGYLNEIDDENLTAQQAVPTTANPTGKTTHSNALLGTGTGDATLDTSFNTSSSGSADNSYYAQTPYAAGDTGSTTAPVNIYQWHTYAIDWHPGQIDWYVDGLLVREEAAGETSSANPTVYVPTQAMAFYLNFWGPSSTFADAYSSTLAVGSKASADQAFYDDVADAEVDVIAATPEPTSAATVGVAAAGLIGFVRPGRRRRPSTRTGSQQD